MVASVATAPNHSSDDRVPEIDDREEEHQEEEIAKELDSDAMVTKYKGFR
jgi:hypothetical protein